MGESEKRSLASLLGAFLGRPPEPCVGAAPELQARLAELRREVSGEPLAHCLASALGEMPLIEAATRLTTLLRWLETVGDAPPDRPFAWKQVGADEKAAVHALAGELRDALAPKLEAEVLRVAGDLRSADDAVFRAAAGTLASLGTAARPAGPALVDAVLSCGGDRSDSLAQALGHVALVDAGVVRSLAAMVSIDDGCAEIAACKALELAGTAAADAIDALLAAIDSTMNPPLYVAALTAAASVAPDDERVLERLLAAWRANHDDLYYRKPLALAICRLERWPDRTAEILVESLLDTHFYDDDYANAVAVRAWHVFEERGATLAAAVPLLARRLEALLESDSTEADRIIPTIVQALAHVGPAAAPALPALRRLAERRPGYLREVRRALRAVGKGSRAG